ncbi:MAG TPA: hypothetical protein VEO54_09710 [Thermoanaerobaculia bacterium]|nr:hypothetical protein [Thermoanaerobaculia bacterium]
MRSLIFALVITTPLFAGHRFNANAIAVSGGGRAAIASVALPPAGGDAAAVAHDYDDGFVRFASAQTAVHGSKEDGAAITATETVITNLWLSHRVHVDRLVVRTNSRQAAGAPEADIDFEGSRIEGLSIDGAPVDVTLDTRWFAERPTFAAVRAAGVEAIGAAVTCSAYETASCGEGRRGIRIPDLGFLTIAEIFVKEGARGITMLRLERTSRPVRRVRTHNEPPPPPGDGDVSIGDSASNGVPIWP